MELGSVPRPSNNTSSHPHTHTTHTHKHTQKRCEPQHHYQMASILIIIARHCDCSSHFIAHKAFDAHSTDTMTIKLLLSAITLLCAPIIVLGFGWFIFTCLFFFVSVWWKNGERSERRKSQNENSIISILMYCMGLWVHSAAYTMTLHLHIDVYGYRCMESATNDAGRVEQGHWQGKALTASFCTMDAPQKCVGFSFC